MPTSLLLVTLYLLQLTNAAKNCQKPNPINFHKIKSCHKSTSSVIYSKKVSSLQDCLSLAREKNGLALNFSPSDAANYTKFLANCQILGCPSPNTTLTMDFAYDYYSAYGNYNENASCVSSVGLFVLTIDQQNYSQTALQCQNMSGDLADITSDYRTMFLSEIINNTMEGWYKVVHIGLDDMGRHGMFKNAYGKLLTCSESWAPGHPRLRHSNNCVTLDNDRLWRTVSCHNKLRGLCELYPQAPSIGESFSKNVTCKETKKKCQKQKQLFDIFHNSSRLDKCAMLNYDNKTNNI